MDKLFKFILQSLQFVFEIFSSPIFSIPCVIIIILIAIALIVEDKSKKVN